MTRALPSPEELREWLEGFVDGVKGRGMQLSGHCPLCEGKDDFSFNLEKGAAQCFRCGKSWGIKTLAEACGQDLPPSWRNGGGGKPPLPAAERESLAVAAATKEAEARRQAEEKARERWGKAAPATVEHPYLAKKNVGPEALRQEGVLLLVPLVDGSGEIRGLQTIDGSGEKRYPAGTKKTGHFWAGSGGFGALGKAEVIAIAEGMATAASVTMLSGCPCVAAMDAGNLCQVAAELRRAFPQAKLLVITDNDGPGQHGGRRAGEVSGALVLPPPPGEPGADWNDVVHDLDVEEASRLFEEAREAAEKNPVEEDGFPTEAEEAAEPGTPPRRLRLIRADTLEMTPPQWLVRGLLERDTLGQIFGEAESFKSFVAVDLACSIATGTPFHGREVARGPVVVLLGEGKSGFRKRIKAWEIFHGRSIKGAPLYITSAPAALNNREMLGELSACMSEVAETEGAPVLALVDTLARNYEGDENSSEDMGAFVRGADTLRGNFRGCTILVIHHSGLAEKTRSRGSSALRGALDCEYLMEREPGTMMARLVCKKMKDGPHPDPLGFRAEEIELGHEEDGSPVTSLALEAAEVEASSRQRRKGSDEKLGEASFVEAAKDYGHIDGSGRFTGLDTETWREAFYRRSTSDNDDTKRSGFSRARRFMVERGTLIVQSGTYFTGTGADGQKLDKEIREALHHDTEPSEAKQKRSKNEAASVGFSSEGGESEAKRSSSLKAASLLRTPEEAQAGKEGEGESFSPHPGDDPPAPQERGANIPNLPSHTRTTESERTEHTTSGEGSSPQSESDPPAPELTEGDRVLLDALAERAHVWRPAYEISTFTGEDVYTTRRRLTALVLAGLVRRDRERYVVAG